MSAHVLLNLLNELGKSDKMRGLSSILCLFCNEFNKFNNTRARMLDSIYHMTNTLESYFWRKNVIILSLCTQRCTLTCPALSMSTVVSFYALTQDSIVLDNNIKGHDLS